MTIPIPIGSEMQIYMYVAVMRTLEESECRRDFDNYENKNGYQKLEITHTKQFLMLQLLLFDWEGNKSTQTCIPLQNLEIIVGGVDKKYELQCIIEHQGTSVLSGHYVSYFKISDDSWYEANDTIITPKRTQELPIQPYICIYKETAAPAQIPQIRNIEITTCESESEKPTNEETETETEEGEIKEDEVKRSQREKVEEISKHEGNTKRNEES